MVFSGALAADLLLIFALLYLTGGGDEPLRTCFFPLVAVNAYYFGPGWDAPGAHRGGPALWAAAALAAAWVGWNAVIILIGLFGLPAFAVGTSPTASAGHAPRWSG